MKQYKFDNDKEFSINELILLGGGMMTTASMFFRKEKMYDYKQFKKGCPVGDYPLALCLANKGKIMMLKEVMNVYRMTTPNSWSAKNSKDERWIRNMEKQAKWWDENLRHIINCKEEILEAKISHLIFRIDIEKNNITDIKNNPYCRKIIDRAQFFYRVILWFWLNVFGHYMSQNRLTKHFTCTCILKKDTGRLLQTCK